MHVDILFEVKKNPEILVQSVKNNGRTMLSSKCAVCGSKKIKIYEKTRSKRNIK